MLKIAIDDSVLSPAKVKDVLLRAGWLLCTRDETGEFLYPDGSTDVAWWAPDGVYENGSVSHAFVCWEEFWTDALTCYLENVGSLDDKVAVIKACAIRGV